MKAVTKRILIVSACLFVAGVIIFGIGFALGGFPGVELTSKGVRSSNQKTPPFKLEKKQIEDFSDADISISSSADITILPSGDDHYYLEYRLDGFYKKPLFSMKDHKLTLEQNGFSVGLIGIYNLNMAPDYYVRLYVPKGKNIDTLKLYSSDGDLSLDSLSCSSAAIKTDYGDAALENGKFGSLELTLESGSLKLNHIQAKDFTLDNDYGDATIKNFSGDSSKIKLSSGDLYLDTVKSGNLNISNEYGETTILLPDRIGTYQFDLSADYGDINLPHGTHKDPSSNNDGDSKYYNAKGTGNNHIKVKSSDGDITIKNR